MQACFQVDGDATFALGSVGAPPFANLAQRIMETFAWTDGDVAGGNSRCSNCQKQEKKEGLTHGAGWFL